MDFQRKESLTRSFTIMVIQTSVLFAVLLVGLYLSSRSAFEGLNTLSEVNQMYDLTRQISQIRRSFGEILHSAATPGSVPQGLSLLKMGIAQDDQLFADVMRLSEDDPDLQQKFRDARDAGDKFKQSLAKLFSDDDNISAETMFATQYELEANDLLTKAQITLNMKSDQLFSRIYERRFHPILVAVVLALLFISLTLFVGFGIVRRFHLAVNELLNATNQVSQGNLTFRARIIRPDEIGQITNSFNNMTTKLLESTVSKDFIENVIESMLDSLILIRPDGKIQQANKITLKMFGYHKHELIGQSYKILFSSGFEFSGTMKDFETVCLSKSGAEIPVAINISFPNGEDNEIACVIHDISGRKKAEDDMKSRNLALAAANRELEAFSYSVSHDLRAPLRGIDGFSQALLEDAGPSLNNEAKTYLNRIRFGVQRMGKLIDDMLNLSKLSRTEMSLRPMDFSAMAKDVFAELQKESPNRNVEMIIPDGLKVVADPALLRILMENLIGNAWKYTSKVAAAKIEMGLISKGGCDQFFIRDNGAGFDMAYAQKLFGAFQRLHRDDEFPGTGVGLATVQRILHRHGGAIRAESEVGKGATFFFHFDT